MSTFLLDVNVMIALIDSAHVHHDRAHHWFAHGGHTAWATCPLTENGVLRIVSHSGYTNSPGTPAAVMELIANLHLLPGHSFWPDDVSLFDRSRVHHRRLLNSARITDTYLLALAIKHGGKLATFDRRLVVNAVIGGAAALQILP